MEPVDTQLTTAANLSTCPTTSTATGGPSGIQGIGSGNNRGVIQNTTLLSPSDKALSPSEIQGGSMATSKEEEEDSSNAQSSDCKSPGQRYVNLYSYFIVTIL